MKSGWFFLGGLAVVCAVSLLLNVYLLRHPATPLGFSGGGNGEMSVAETEAVPSASITPTTSSRVEPVKTPERAVSSTQAKHPLLVKRVYYASYDRKISIRFATHGIVDFPLSANIELSPAVPDLEVERSDENEWELGGAFTPEQTYVLTLRAGVASSTGEVIQDKLVFNVKIPPLSPKVRFLTTGPYYPAPRTQGSAAGWSLPLGVTNLDRVRVEVYRAYENNLALRNRLDYRWMDHLRKLKTIELTVDGVSNRERLLDLDLTAYLSDTGCGIYMLRAMDADMNTIDDVDVVLSDLGLSVAMDNLGRNAHVLVRSLTTGAPVPDADVQVVSSKNQTVAKGITDASGLIKMNFLPQFNDDAEYPEIVVVRTGTDASYLLLNRDNRHDLSVFANAGRTSTEGPEAYVYTERGVCRPGETITVSLYVRERSGAATAAVSAPCQLTVCDPQGRVFASGRVSPDALGFATLPVKLPTNARTGAYTVKCGIDDKTAWGSTTFMVATYVPDRIKVSLKTGQTSVTPEDILTCQVSARYYFGAEMTEGNGDFRVSAELARQPGHWRDYQVGDATTFVPGRTHTERNIHLAGSGMLIYPGFAAVGGQSSAPVSLMVEATVREPGGRGVTERMTMLCHPTPFYLGIRHESSEARRDNEVHLRFRRLAWGAEDKVSDEPLTLNLQWYRLTWDCVRKVGQDGESNYLWEDIRTAVAGPANLKLTGIDGELMLPNLSDGRYELIATANNGVRTQMTFWHWQGEGGSRSANPNVLAFVTDRPQYAPGDTAEVTLNVPADGYLYVVAGEHHLQDSYAQKVSRGIQKFLITIPATVSSGDYFAGVTLVSPGRSATRSFGLLRLPLNQAVNRLNIELLTPAQATPGEEISIEVKLTGADGQPRSGQVQLFAVDEGILSLTAYITPDIFAFFHGHRFCHFDFYDMYSALFPDIRIGSNGQIGGDGIDQGQLTKRLGEIKAAAPAIWIGPPLTVPESGTAQMSVRLPEHVGALRVMAVGVSPTSVGSTERELVLREQISILPTVPRALAPGDEFTLTLTAFNHDLPDGSAELEVLMPPALATKGASKHQFILTKGATHTMQLPCIAGGITGSWNIVCVLKLGSVSHRSVLPITVRSPVPPVTRAITAMIPAGENKRFNFDKADWQGTPTAKLRVSASPALGVKDALDWLNDYPYGCLEQTTAAAFPFLGVDTMLKIGMINADVAASIRPKAEMAMGAILAMMQNDGSFSMWPGSPWTWPAASIFAAHYLFAAEQMLHCPLDNGVRQRLQQFLCRMAEDASESRWQRAYASFTLAVANDQDFLQSARNLLLEPQEDLPAFLAAAALMRGGYAAEGAVHLRRLLDIEVWRDDQSTAGIGFITDSACRQAMVLAILMDVMPNHEAALRLAIELQSALRPDGKGWGTTHTNAWATYGLAAFAARQGIGKAQGTVNANTGPDLPFNTESIQEIDLGNGQDFVLRNTGTAPCYVRLLISGIPTRLEERRDVLEINRQYLTAEGQNVTRVEHGQLLTVRLTIKAIGTIKNLVLVDLLPGGLEIEDELLATRAYAVPLRNRDDGQILRPVYIEKRDDRFLWFGDMLSGGTAVITYQARAVSRGTFVLPPVRMESMYEPDVQGTFVPTGHLEIH